MKSTDSKPSWLKRIQENSWEPEILISGGAFFTLFTLSDSFMVWVWDTREVMGLKLPGLQIIVFVIIAAIEGITFLFLLHLLIRAYWTGLIGISYVFPDGMKKEYESSLNPKFLPFLEEAKNIDAYIDKVEKVASLIFGITIRFVLSVSGVAVTLTVVALLFQFVPSSISIPTVLLMLLFLFIYAFDVVSGMQIRKSRFARAYYPIYRTLDLITLSFVFRPVSQILLSNVTLKKIVPIGFIIISISFFSAYTTVTRSMLVKFYHIGELYDKSEITEAFLPYYYLNHWTKGDYKPAVQLGRDIIEEYPTIMVFIEYRPKMDEQYFRDSFSSFTVEAFKEKTRIKVDDDIIELDEFSFGKNPSTGRMGLIGYLSLGKLATGKHLLAVEYLNRDNQWTLFHTHSIPFWKE